MNIVSDESLQPVLDQINEIEANVMKLEKAAYKLDAYSRRLENKVKSLERKWGQLSSVEGQPEGWDEMRNDHFEIDYYSEMPYENNVV